ncbi:MAG: alpha/beta hydrolase [Robiginitomaculum sp.]|nr:alpha/beta hydrolase [Robiginitomaculum sp.]
MEEVLKHKTASGETICYSVTSGLRPTVVWLGGFRSDMNGSKAQFVDKWARENGRSFIRFDYFGHGQSSGNFKDGTISKWLEDALEVIDHLTSGSLVLLGSSMGGWLALLAALARPDRVQSLVLIAPAADFTQKLMWDKFDQKVQDEITQQGHWMQPSPYGEVPITKSLIEDGKKHLLLGEAISFAGPVRILQGQLDQDVPWQHAMKLVAKLQSTDVVFSLVKDGDHSLSAESDLSRLQSVLQELTETV